MMKRASINKTINTKTADYVEKYQRLLKPRKWCSIASFIMAITPILIFLYCMIASGGSFNENGAGAVWLYLMLYYWSFIGVVFAILSVIFGVMGLKGQYRKLAIVSLCIKMLTLALLLFSYLR